MKQERAMTVKFTPIAEILGSSLPTAYGYEHFGQYFGMSWDSENKKWIVLDPEGRDKWLEYIPIVGSCFACKRIHQTRTTYAKESTSFKAKHYVRAAIALVPFLGLVILSIADLVATIFREIRRPSLMVVTNSPIPKKEGSDSDATPEDFGTALANGISTFLMGSGARSSSSPGSVVAKPRTMIKPRDETRSQSEIDEQRMNATKRFAGGQ